MMRRKMHLHEIHIKTIVYTSEGVPAQIGQGAKIVVHALAFQNKMKSLTQTETLFNKTVKGELILTASYVFCVHLSLLL